MLLLSVVFVNAAGLIVLLRCFDLFHKYFEIINQALVFSSSYLMVNLIFGLN